MICKCVRTVPPSDTSAHFLWWSHTDCTTASYNIISVNLVSRRMTAAQHSRQPLCASQGDVSSCNMSFIRAFYFPLQLSHTNILYCFVDFLPGKNGSQGLRALPEANACWEWHWIEQAGYRDSLSVFVLITRSSQETFFHRKKQSPQMQKMSLDRTTCS